MREASSGSISRIVRTEVGRLKGTPGVMILRVEHLPLAEDASDTRPEVTVFVMGSPPGIGSRRANLGILWHIRCKSLRSRIEKLTRCASRAIP